MVFATRYTQEAILAKLLPQEMCRTEPTPDQLSTLQRSFQDLAHLKTDQKPWDQSRGSTFQTNSKKMMRHITPSRHYRTTVLLNLDINLFLNRV